MTLHDSLHSSVSKFKNEAKQLKKQSNLSLMQAQTAIAKKNGYNNWHDFLQKLKNIFVSEPKYDYLIKPDEVTSNNINNIPKDGFYHIGQEAKNGLEHWLSWNQSRCHLHVVEEYSSIYSMDIHIAKQAILNNQPIVFTSSDTEETKVLINFALFNNRRKIFLFDTMEQIQDFKEYKNYKLSLSNYTVSSLSSFLHHYNHHDNLGDMYKNEFMNFLQLASSITIYQKEVENIPITLNSMLNNGSLKQFEKYVDIFPIEHDMKKHLESNITFLSNDIYKKNLFENHYLDIIQKIKATNIFNDDFNENKETNFDTLYYKEDEYPIFIFLSNKSQLPESIISEKIMNYSQLVHLTVISYYSQLLAKILGIYIENRNNYEYKKGVKSDSITNDSIAFIMRNPPLYCFRYGTIAAQNRAIGASFIFTFNTLPHNYSLQFDSLLANANNYFFGQFTGKIESNNYSKNLFDKKLSEHLIKQVYHSKKIKCEYKSNDIENLLLNEYLVFNKTGLLKINI